MLEQKIEELKKQLVKLGNRVERMVEKSVEGLLEKNADKLSSVIEEDEPVVNQKEVEIEKNSTGLIAVFHPEARYLRTILMAIKMVNDLERIGDLAVNIAQSSQRLLSEPEFEAPEEIKALSDTVVSMLRDAMKSFIEENSMLAKEVLKRDDKADNLRDKVYRLSINKMKENPENVEKYFALARMAHDLERIADLSTNTCEDVIYIVEGLIVKHMRLD